jgi:hypothetical protein
MLLLSSWPRVRGGTWLLLWRLLPTNNGIEGKARLHNDSNNCRASSE